PVRDDAEDGQVPGQLEPHDLQLVDEADDGEVVHGDHCVGPAAGPVCAGPVRAGEDRAREIAAGLRGGVQGVLPVAEPAPHGEAGEVLVGAHGRAVSRGLHRARTAQEHHVAVAGGGQRLEGLVDGRLEVDVHEVQLRVLAGAADGEERDPAGVQAVDPRVVELHLDQQHRVRVTAPAQFV